MAQIHVIGLNAGRFENLGGSNDSGGLVIQPNGASSPGLEIQHLDAAGTGLVVTAAGGTAASFGGGAISLGNNSGATVSLGGGTNDTINLEGYIDSFAVFSKTNLVDSRGWMIYPEIIVPPGGNTYDGAHIQIIAGNVGTKAIKVLPPSTHAAPFNGGDVYVGAGWGSVDVGGSGGGDGGNIEIYGGAGGSGGTAAAGVGGSLLIYGGNAGAPGATGNDGGDVDIYGGAATGAGTPGGVRVATTGSGGLFLGNATGGINIYSPLANYMTYTAAPAWLNAAFGTTLMTAGVKLNDPVSGGFPTVATLQGGAASSGTDKAGGVLLLGGDSTVATDGGPVLIVGGSSTVAGMGGTVFVASGQPGPTGKSGDLNLATWSGGTTSGDSGKLDMSTGNVTSGTSGLALLQTGAGTTASGQITLRSGNATTTSGSVTITTGTGATVGAINIGSSGGVAAVNIGQAGHTTTVTGALAVNQAGAANAIAATKTNTGGGNGVNVSMGVNTTGSGLAVAQSGSGVGVYVSKWGVAGVGGNGVTILMDTSSTGYALQVTGGNASGIYATASAGGLGVGKSVLWVESTSGTGDAATIRAIGGTGGALYVSASTSTALSCSSGTGLAASLSRSSTGGNSVNITHSGTASGDNALYVAPGAVTAGHGISVNCPSMNGGHGIYISYAGGAGSAISISQGATSGPAIAVSNSATSGPLMNLTAASGSNTSYGATISVAGSGTALIAVVTGSGTGKVAEFNAPSNKSVRVLNNGTIEIDGSASPAGRAFHRVVGASRMVAGNLAAVIGSTHGAALSGAYLGAYGSVDGALFIPLEIPDGSALYGFSIYVNIGNTAGNTSTAGVYLARVTGGASSNQEFFDDSTNAWGAGSEYTQSKVGTAAFFTAGPTGAAGLTNPQTLDRANYDYYLRVRFTSSLAAFTDATIRGRCYHADLWGQWLKLSPGP